MRDPYDLMSLHLWDLRAQVEAQLRCVTTVHRLYDQLPPPGDPRRASNLRDMQKDVAELITTNAWMRGVATQVLEGLNAIADSDDGPDMVRLRKNLRTVSAFNLDAANRLNPVTPEGTQFPRDGASSDPAA
jgi:hypothetical protein